MYETILVGSDGSDAAREAVAHAIQLARSVDATLHAVTVVDVQSNPMRFSITEVDELNRAKATLIDQVTAAGESDAVTVELRRGDAPTTLLSYAEEVAADLLVVGQSDVGSLEAALFGTTTEQLAEQTHIPLTIIPGPAE